jgi:glycosyltransferase involved in cell wall biosynthesis
VKIVIDTIPLLSPFAGVGHYTHQLVRHFRSLSSDHSYTYYCGFFARSLPPIARYQKLRKLSTLVSGVRLGTGLLRRSIDLLSQSRIREFDLYFEPNFIPRSIRAKRVVTTVHDFSFHFFPEWHPKDRIDYFRANFYDNISRSDRIITDSGYIRTEALNVLKLPQEMITPVHLGLEHELFRVESQDSLNLVRRKFSLDRNFILFVGTQEPRKNLRRLLDAYAALPAPIRKEFQLVLVGPEGWKREEWVQTLHNLGRQVISLGYVDARELAALYNLASLLVYPSLYEGFGLPPLEAMACGCPVIVSKLASMPEVCGDAAYYVDPKDTDNIAEGIGKVVGDETLRRSLRQRGLERAKLFSWQKTASETLDIFDDVLSTPKNSNVGSETL